MCSAVRGFVRRLSQSDRNCSLVELGPVYVVIRILKSSEYNGTKAFIRFGKTMIRSWIRVLNLVNRARALAGNWAPRRGAPRIIVA